MAEQDPGYGPPPGRPNGPARGGGTPFADLAKQYLSGLQAGTLDPAFLRLRTDVLDSNSTKRAGVVYGDVPLIAIQNTWSVEEVRGALYAHMIGQFYQSGMLCDSMLGDDRVSSTLNSRASALFGRESRFQAANDSRAAKEVLDAWQNWWPILSGDSAMREMQDYCTMMGFSHAQLIWDRNQPGLDYAPRLYPWHPTFEWYDWFNRCFQAISDSGMVPILGGNSKWVELSPYMSYRSWVRGALRPVAEPWLLRHFGFRDMARFGEVHGNPTRVGFVPIVSAPEEREMFKQSIANLGADNAMMVPRGVDINDGMGFDYKLVEATSAAWEVHPAQIDRCDMAIVLALLTVGNLTTQVEGGSYGAAKSQMDLRSEGAQLDNQTWKKTIHPQIARPFAYLNYGDANLAPWTWFDVVGRTEYSDNAKQFQAFGTGVEVLRRGGIQFRDSGALRAYAAKRFGLDGLPDFDFVAPVSGHGGQGSS